MQEKHMRLGEYLRRKRQADPRELTLSDMSKELGISLSYLSDIECGRKKNFEADLIEKFVTFLGLSVEEKARLYDLAAKEKNTIPADIEDVLMYEEIGDMARFALRQSNAGNATEEDWKQFIRSIEDKRNAE